MNAEKIYLTMLGELTEPLPGVPNAFAPGQPCEKLYRKVYDAKCRLCDRLGEDENNELETILDSFFAINREMCIRMYRLGCFHADDITSSVPAPPGASPAPVSRSGKHSCG